MSVHYVVQTLTLPYSMLCNISLESGELAILSILNRGNMPVALWRSSNYDSIAPAPAPAVADEKSVPWWRRVLLSPYRFVKRQILKRRDPQDDRVIPMQITASCEADNKVIIRSGNHVSFQVFNNMCIVNSSINKLRNSFFAGEI